MDLDTVWVLFGYCTPVPGADTLIGVYSSKESAQKAHREARKEFDGCFIVSMPLIP